MREVQQPSFFIWRGRHPSENKAPEWGGALDTWLERDDGTATLIIEGKTQNPTVLEQNGFTLDSFLGEIAASAVRDRDAAMERAEKAETERDTAKAEWTEMRSALQQAERDKSAALAIVADLMAQNASLAQEREAREAVAGQLAEAMGHDRSLEKAMAKAAKD